MGISFHIFIGLTESFILRCFYHIHFASSIFCNSSSRFFATHLLVFLQLIFSIFCNCSSRFSATKAIDDMRKKKKQRSIVQKHSSLFFAFRDDTACVKNLRVRLSTGQASVLPVSVKSRRKIHTENCWHRQHPGHIACS